MAARSRGIHRRVGQAELRRHGDFARELAEQLGLLRVLPALAVHDVLELGMSGHRLVPGRPVRDFARARSPPPWRAGARVGGASASRATDLRRLIGRDCGDFKRCQCSAATMWCAIPAARDDFHRGRYGRLAFFHPGALAASCFSRRRCTDEGIRIASRYFATVRRAISMPASRSCSTMVSSDSTFCADSRRRSAA